MGVCSKCGQPFVIAGDKAGQCKPCKRAYSRQHYLDNKAAYIAKANRSKLKVRIRNFQLLCEYLSHHPCVDCGEKEVLVLEFDHIGPKEADVGYLVQAHSWERILQEIAKCEARCANCHRRITAQRGGWLRLRINGISPLVITWARKTKAA